MATGIFSWSQTAASNANADSTINWAEGQAPSTVNDSARAMMAVLRRWVDDFGGTLPANGIMETAGSANAQTLTTNQSWSGSLAHGWTLTFKIGAGLTNTGACTLAVDSQAAKPLQYVSGTNLVGSELAAGSVFTATYHQPADAWVIHRSPGDIPSGTLMLFVQTAAPVGWVKSTTHNDKALRVVSGTASSGGATAFSSVFASALTTGGTAISQANLPSVNLSSAGLSASIATGGLSVWGGTWRGSSGTGVNGGTPYDAQAVTLTSTITGTIPLGGSGTAHTHTLNLDLYYVDVIIATKS